MPPSSSTTPRLPAANRVADTILDKLDEWQRDRAGPPRVWLAGEEGAGVSTTLKEVVAEVAARKIAALHVGVPDLDIDGPFHFTMQLATRLREHGSNGVLDVVVDPRASLPAKIGATLSELGRRNEDTVVVLDLPPSWTRPSFDTDALGVFHRARSLVHDVLVAAEKAKQPVLLGARGWRSSKHEPFLERLEIKGTSDPKLLADPSTWGDLAKHAAKLCDVLGQRVEVSSPLALRLGVGLLALDVDPELVRVASEAGLPSLVELLAISLAQRPALNATFECLSVIRFPVAPAVVEKLVSPDLTCAEREIVQRVFVLDHGGKLAMHPALQRFVRRRVPMRSDLHATIASYLVKPDRPATLPSHWSTTADLLEYVYQAARGLLLDAAKSLALDASSLCEIGRALSLARKDEEALDAYETALSVDPTNEYAGAYVPFHLERLGRDPGRAEKMFHQRWYDERDNAWWARRYIRCLARRGRIAAAHDVWKLSLVSLGSLDRDGDAARATWLARNFHSGVAQAFLDRGALEEAREVLERVGPTERQAEIDLVRMWNRLQHAEEADELGFSPFPLVVTFEQRWSRPHVLPMLHEGLQYTAWYPGRIVALAERVVLDLVEAPRKGLAARPFRLELTQEDFLKDAMRTSLEAIEVGQFVEVGVKPDGTRRIDLHPIRGRGIEIDVGFLRDVPGKGTAGG